LNILEETIDPLLICYVGAMYDVLMTTWGICTGIGVEANPLLNWTQPAYLIPIKAMLLFIIGMVGFIIMLKALEILANSYNRDMSKTVDWLNRLFVFGGLWHFMTGSTWWV
jgi:hypothetical protein